MSWLSYILLQWILKYIYLFELWFSPDICPGVGLLDHIVVLFFFSLRSLHTAFHSGCINLYSYQECREISTLWRFFLDGHSNLIVVLTWISLIISDVEHLFMCFRHLYVCFQKKNVYLDLPLIYFLILCLFFDIELHELFVYFGD